MKGMMETSECACLVVSYHCHIIWFDVSSHYVVIALQALKEVLVHCEGREQVG